MSAAVNAPVNAASARRRYVLVSALTWLPPGLMMAPMVLLMAGRGLSLAQIGLTMGAYALVVVLLELPTGGLADVLGRRWVLAASAAIGVAGYTTLALAHSLPVFVLAAVLKGVARALSSGPAQAWYVDTLHAGEGPDADLKPGLARGESMGSAALCAGVLVGGFLPLALGGVVAEPLAVPVLLAAGASAVLFAVALVALPEPPHERPSLAEVVRDVPRTVAAGVRLGARDAVLARLLGVSVAGGVTLCSIELLTPIRLAELAGDAGAGGTAYGVVTAVGFAASAVGSAVAPAVARTAGGSARGAMASGIVAVLALAGLAASAALPAPAGMVATAVAYLMLFVGFSASALLRAELMHGRVDRRQRATLLSVDSLALQAGGFAANIGLGVLAGTAGIGAAWALAAVVLLAVLPLYAGISRVRAATPSRAPAPPGRSGSDSRPPG
ncbi:MFS transporter [Spongiactinospora sp. TRM90649]|uniref:MFS transporter n=1 Tax=Spongiactinospora sp. TRM90649 TaxID=3031114 RepID=UPI0023F659C6|nr:MFS transporter [Spongiactinospora sp. TRM90649]MDF5756443.1 MFS transporter [Spongiactinospora sp. TRM90649]